MITQETKEGLKKMLSNFGFQIKNQKHIARILKMDVCFDALWHKDDLSIKLDYGISYFPPIKYKLYIIENRQDDLIEELNKYNITVEQLNSLSWGN